MLALAWKGASFSSKSQDTSFFLTHTLYINALGYAFDSLEKGARSIYRFLLVESIQTWQRTALLLPSNSEITLSSR